MSAPTDSIFTAVTRRLVIPSLSDGFHLVPVGDIHAKCPGHDASRFAEFLRHAKLELAEQDVPTYYLGMGDEHDFTAWSERKRLQHADLHEATESALDDRALLACDEMITQFAPLKDRMLGMVQGNHHWVFLGSHVKEDGEWRLATRGEARNPQTFAAWVTAGETSTEFICRQLGCPWLGYLSYLRLVVTTAGSPGDSRALDLVACHGKAGGKLLGTSINQVEDMRRIFPDADIYLMGHNHERHAVPVTHLEALSPQRTGETALTIKQRTQYLGRTGSFLRGYVPNAPSYVVRKLLRPAELGVIKFKLQWHHHTVTRRVLKISCTQ